MSHGPPTTRPGTKEAQRKDPPNVEALRKALTKGINKAQKAEEAYINAHSQGLAKSSSRETRQDRENDVRQHRERLKQLGEKRAPVEPHSCETCRRFVIDVSGTQQRDRSGYFVAPKDVLFPDITYAVVAKAAQEGCVFCQRFMEFLDVPEHEDHEAIHAFARVGSGWGGEYDISSISFGMRDPNRRWERWLKDKTRLESQYYWDVFAQQGDIAAAFISNRPINTNPASEETFQLARSWLAECKHSHTGCPNPSAHYHPTRLIKIQGETVDMLKLSLAMPPSDERIDYVCVSYCWGGPQHTQTTRENFQQYRNEIPIQQLPKTLQDAIKVAFHLRIPYIWVDSLCIIQDDQTDKSREIPMMRKIYSWAMLTISVSRAYDAEEGFLQQRDMCHEAYRTVVELPYRIPGAGPDELGSITVFNSAPINSDNRLESRAWAFQERFLSSRILDFSGSQMRWSCASATSGQGFIDGGSVSDHSWSDIAALRAEQHVCQQAYMRANYGKPLNYYLNVTEAAIDLWHNIVGVYTERDLTVPTDRILAISGIAHWFNYLFGDEYCAGHWRSTLPSDLLWAMKDRVERLPRPKVYQGPSWSWTAVEGQMHFWYANALREKGKVTLEVLEYDAELKEETAPFGALEQGCLMVKGRAKAARWMRNDNPFERNTSERDLLKGPDEDEDFLAAYMYVDAAEDDFLDPSKQWVDVMLLEVGHNLQPGDESSGSIGLVLRDQGDGFYTRVGIFEFREHATSLLKSNKTTSVEKPKLHSDLKESDRWMLERARMWPAFLKGSPYPGIGPYHPEVDLSSDMYKKFEEEKAEREWAEEAERQRLWPGQRDWFEGAEEQVLLLI